MQEKLRALDLRYQALEAQLSAPETYQDPDLVAKLNREQRELEPVVTAHRSLERARRDMAEAEEMTGDPELSEMAREEFARAIRELYEQRVLPVVPKGLCAAIYTQLSDVEDVADLITSFIRDFDGEVDA